MTTPDSNTPPTFHEFEEAGWSDSAVVDNYDAGFRKLTIQVVPALLDSVGACQRTRLLDVATGPGYAAAAAFDRGAEVTAIDFSPAMIATAAERYPGVQFRIGDAQNLDFPAGSFDAVIVNFGLMHFEQPELALGEAFRVLRSGGCLGSTVWSGPDRAIAVGLLQDALQAHGDLSVPLPPGTPFFRFSDQEECQRVLESAGFIQCQSIEIMQMWTFDSAEGLLEALEEGTVRNRALLKAQSPERMGAIREAFRRSLGSYTAPDGSVSVPMPAVLAYGRRP